MHVGLIPYISYIPDAQSFQYRIPVSFPCLLQETAVMV